MKDCQFGVSPVNYSDSELYKVIFDIFIALRIDMHNFTHVLAMDTAKISFGHLQTFP